MLRRHRPNRTTPVAWICAAVCAVLWSIIILAGIAVLIVYLIFRPRNPQLDIAHATLNSAYLDSDADGNAVLLNADLTLLANFSNPNRKIDVVFARIDLDLVFGGTMVAAAGVEPFLERRGEAALRSVRLVASQVVLPEKEAGEWRRQVGAAAAGGGGGEGVVLELRGRMRTRAEMGGLIRFTYWLRCRCRMVVAAPPGGALIAANCKTSR